MNQFFSSRVHGRSGAVAAVAWGLGLAGLFGGAASAAPGDLLTSFNIPDADPQSVFGTAAGDDNWLLVGATLASDGGTTGPGAVCLYYGPTFTYEGPLRAPSPEAYDHFGTDIVDLGNGRFAVSAPGPKYSSDPAPRPGTVYVYDAATSFSAPILTLQAPSPINGDRFGASLAATGEGRLVIGAPTGPIGAVHVYDTSTGVLLRTFLPPGGEGGFGKSVKAGGNRAMIGAYAGTDFSRAYFADLDNGTYIRNPESPSNSFFSNNITSSQWGLNCSPVANSASWLIIEEFEFVSNFCIRPVSSSYFSAADGERIGPYRALGNTCYNEVISELFPQSSNRTHLAMTSGPRRYNYELNIDEFDLILFNGADGTSVMTLTSHYTGLGVWWAGNRIVSLTPGLISYINEYNETAYFQQATGLEVYEGLATVPAPPSAPASALLTRDSASSNLAWAAAAGSTVQYEIERKTTPEDAFTPLTIVPESSTSYTDSTPGAGTSQYRVRAVNLAGGSDFVPVLVPTFAVDFELYH